MKVLIADEPNTQISMATATVDNRPASATLMSHMPGSKMVTLSDLASFPTPPATKTWHPVPHSEVPTIIEEMVLSKGWSFANHSDGPRFRLGVTATGSKLFGVTTIAIPGVTTDSEFQLALGFRNSHDKSIALQIAVGSRVIVCDNMMMTGDIRVRNEHVSNIDVRKMLDAAFNLAPAAASHMIDWFGGMRKRFLSKAEGVDFLAKCVEYKALPIVNFMDARASWLTSFDGDEEQVKVNHGGTLWAAYQAVTAQWKTKSVLQLPEYSKRLNDLLEKDKGKQN